MKLYGNIKSERATKGQGGNEFLEIEILNSDQAEIASIRVIPCENGIAKISVINDKNLSNIELKEKSKKCECQDPLCAKCLLANCQDDNCKFHPLAKKKEFREMYKNRK